ncbi:MAG: septation protein [Moraxellaceae bacterium]|jgi:intracellular septation protein|nr:septation protein [Moraxellaceae bacterium]
MPHFTTTAQIKMKQWLDYIPLILFLVSFKTLGIFTATGVLIASTVLLYGFFWFREGKLEKNHKIVLVVTVVFGGLTLALHDETFIKWKAPIVNWVLALFFLGSHFVGDKLAIERLMGHAVTLPASVWRGLNLSWVLFFIALGAANLYVAFTHESIWVEFKVFGSLGLTFLFVILQMAAISRYLPRENADTGKD